MQDASGANTAIARIQREDFWYQGQSVVYGRIAVPVAGR